MSAAEKEKLEKFVQEGGNLISTFDTSLYDELGETLEKPGLMDVLGIAAFEGKDDLPQDHIRVDANLFTKGITQSFIPAPGLFLKVRPADNTETYMVQKIALFSVR